MMFSPPALHRWESSHVKLMAPRFPGPARVADSVLSRVNLETRNSPSSKVTPSYPKCFPPVTANRPEDGRGSSSAIKKHTLLILLLLWSMSLIHLCWINFSLSQAQTCSSVKIWLFITNYIGKIQKLYSASKWSFSTFISWGKKKKNCMQASHIDSSNAC